jgi:hypothetical protein
MTKLPSLVSTLALKLGVAGRPRLYTRSAPPPVLSGLHHRYDRAAVGLY